MGYHRPAARYMSAPGCARSANIVHRHQITFAGVGNAASASRVEGEEGSAIFVEPYT